MAGTANLGITYVAPSQSQKETTINGGFDAIDAAMSGKLAVAMTNNAASLTKAQFVGNVAFAITGLTGAGTLTIPLTKRLFLADNTANTYGVTVKGSSGPGAFVAASSAVMLYCDGVNVQALSGGSGGGGGGGSAGVQSFNTRTGAVTLTQSDVTQVLGFMPLSGAVTRVVAGAGLDGGTISTSGTIALSQIGTMSVLGNSGTVDPATPSAIPLGPNFTISNGQLAIQGNGTGTVTQVVAGGGLDGGSITGVGTLSIHGVGAATAGQTLQSDGAGGVAFTSSIPAGTAGELLSTTGTAGVASTLALGAGLSSTSGTLSVSGTQTGLTISGGTLSGTTSNTGTISGGSITGLPTPSVATDAATKGYVDGLVQSLVPKPTAAAATTAALPANTYANGTNGEGATLIATAAGALTVDGVSLAAGDRVLVKNEATAANNGLYVVTAAGSTSTPYTLTRDTSMDDGTEFQGALIAVEQFGTTNPNTLWLCTPPGAVTPGTTAIPFTQLNSATSLQAGAGLSISANTISLSPIPTLTLLANAGGTSAAPTAVPIGAGLSLSGGTLTATGITSVGAQSYGSSIGGFTAVNAGSGLQASVANGVLTLEAPGGGTVAEVTAGAGLAGGTITTSGTISLAPIAAGELMGNPGAADAVPSGVAVGAGLTLSAGGTLSLDAQPYVIAGYVPGTLSASQILLAHKFASAVTIPANFAAAKSGATSDAQALVNATAQTVLSVATCPAGSDPTTAANWTQVGTLTIAAGGSAATGATSGGAAVSCAVGDMLRVLGPSTADSTLANLMLTIAGDR
jgi:hypothetical protein